ncbi:MAG: GIY-YIG nuclease family protein, partial [Kiloniellaceae bacterium]|nr:GIY-YIG nuclease family protein [Kiloniellaceae bacterium]
MEKSGWIYIMTNKPDGKLYIGVTSNLARRVHEHREGAVEGFTKRNNLKRLVYAEQHNYIERAIQRERRVKKWPRRWKIDLITSQNPDWRD